MSELDVLGAQIALRRPAGQRTQIAAVGTARGNRQPAACQVAVEQSQGVRPSDLKRTGRVVVVGVFYIHIHEGAIATGDQLIDAGIIGPGADPELPWHRIAASDDATTLWYAAMKKQEKGIWLGTLTFRHGDHHSLLLDQGWVEVPVDEIGPSAT